MDVFPFVFIEEGCAAFALQITFQGWKLEGGADAASLWALQVAITGAHEAAARVVVDVAALGFELAWLQRHHIDIAVGEEGLAVGGA